MNGMDIEIPDAEDAADDLGDLEIMFARKGHYDSAAMVSGAMRRLRADAEEIARLTAKVEELERDIVWAATRGVNVGLSDDEIIRNVRNGRLDAARTKESTDGPL